MEDMDFLESGDFGIDAVGELVASFIRKYIPKAKRQDAFADLAVIWEASHEAGTRRGAYCMNKAWEEVPAVEESE